MENGVRGGAPIHFPGVCLGNMPLVLLAEFPMQYLYCRFKFDTDIVEMVFFVERAAFRRAQCVDAARHVIGEFKFIRFRINGAVV